MALTLHFCEEYKVRTSRANICDGNQSNAINRLFQWLNDRADHAHALWGNENEFDYSDRIEWDKDGVREAVVILRDMQHTGESWRHIPTYSPMPTNHYESSGDWSMEQWQKEELIDAEQRHGVTPAAVADFLQDALDRSEESINYIVFLWI